MLWSIRLFGRTLGKLRRCIEELNLKCLVELAPVVGRHGRGDFLADFGLALSGPCHEQPPNCGVGRAHGPGVFETERADDRFDEAEVGQDEDSNAEAPGVFKTVASFPTGVAQVGGARGR